MKVEGFKGGTDVQKSLNLSDNQCINLVPSSNDDGSITAFPKVDGLKQEAVLSGIPTGAYKTSTGRSFYVTGTTLYELNSNLTSTSRGTLTAGTYNFSDNGIELICVNGIDGWLFVLATNTLSQIKVLTGDVTISVANPAVVTKTSHGLIAGDRILLSSTGVLPSGLTTSTPYYVLAAGLTANAFEVSETSGGTAISTITDYYSTPLNIWYCIAYGNGIFVSASAFGNKNAVMISSNGITWTAINAPATAFPWRSIAWNGTVFCAVSSGLSNQVMTSPDGITWTLRTSASFQGWRSITWNGTVFCAVAEDGAVGVQVMTSPDGITWTSRTSAAAKVWRGVAWNGTVFAAISPDGIAANQVMTSPDGVTWTIRTAATAQNWRSIAWNGTVFCAVSTDAITVNQVMTSPDGITWTSRTSAAAQRWTSITWNGTVFCAVAEDGAVGVQVMTSPDGITWTSRTSAAAQSWQGIESNGTRLVAVSLDGTNSRAMISDDNGVTWTNTHQYGTHTYLTLGYGFPNGCKTVSYMNGRFIACEPNTQNFFVSEPLDGWYWDQLNVQTVDSNPDYCYGQVVSNNELIVFCENSGEAFYDSGTVPTPFVRHGSSIFEVGCTAPYSIAKLDNSVFWLGNSEEGKGCIYRLNGYTPMKISTYSIEQTIQAMSTTTDARAFTYQKDGHHFYVLTFPTGNKTFVYDANTSLWHERASFISSTFGRWEPQDHLFFNGKHYVTDVNSTNLYSIDSDTYSNGANPCKVVRSFRAPESNMKQVAHHKLQLEAEFGVGITGGSDPQVMLRWSNDGGHTWTNEMDRSLGIGTIGEYSKQVSFKRLGITKGPARIYELSCSADVKLMLKDVYLE